ncbi:ATP-binding protein [Gemmatimonas sp.]|uniref:sensor histidine kinase n=1 Tax=Gemmatimonas sp. TaxID=1962908 RepID=UPI0022BDB4B9|nr:ATP-binding protein [Gemmatimonas sp.]MCZ8206421.1 ATP-binding protein [Gemmatimonas sp.]
MLPLRPSILLRLTALNAGVLAVILIAFAWVGFFTLERVVRQRAATVVRESARAVAGAILVERRAAAARGEVETVRGEHEQAVLRELRVGDLDIFITDEAEQLMAARQPEVAQPAVVLPTAVRTLMAQVRAQRDAGALSDSAVVVRDLVLESGPARAALLRVVPEAGDENEPALLITALRSDVDDTLLLRQVRTTILFAIPLASLVALIAGFLLARRSLAPLDAIVTRTAGITAANLDERLPVVHAHDELGRLARIINDLLARVGDAFRTQRQFVADASHELRTPIAIIRGEAEVTLRRSSRSETEYREALTVVHGESVRLSRIVDDLFLLTRVDAGDQPGRDEAMRHDAVDMPALVHDAVRSVRSLADSQRVTLEVEPESLTPATTVRGDAMLLHRLVLNLLDNALKHAPVGTTVRVRQQRTANALHLTVADEGPGIPPAERERVFERFVHGVQRARDAETTGAGLGLAIARAIAQAHGGRIGLLDVPRGATFEVVLPLLSPAGDHP